LLELLLLYFASATSIALTGPGDFSIDEVIIRVLRSESNDEDVQESSKTKADTGKLTSQEDSTNKGGIFQFLQANLLSDTSN
jgi:putative oxidoreductase